MSSPTRIFGSAIVTGIDATGVSAFGERCGAGVCVGPEGGGGVVTTEGVVDVQATMRNERVSAIRRMHLPESKKKAPAVSRGGFRRLQLALTLRQDEADHDAAVAQTAFRGRVVAHRIGRAAAFH